MKKESQLLKNVGKVFEIFRKLINAVLERNGSDDDVLKFLSDDKLVGQIADVLMGTHEITLKAQQIIHIDRSKPFDLAKFIGTSWSIEEEDSRSLELTEIDLNMVQFEDMLKSSESRIKGEDKLKRLKKAGHVRLDTRIFQTLWEDQALIPKSWKEKIGGNTRYIFFDGTVLRNPYGNRCVLCLYWYHGQWRWDYGWLDSAWYAYFPSVVLASN